MNIDVTEKAMEELVKAIKDQEEKPLRLYVAGYG